MGSGLTRVLLACSLVFAASAAHAESFGGGFGGSPGFQGVPPPPPSFQGQGGPQGQVPPPPSNYQPSGQPMQPGMNPAMGQGMNPNQPGGNYQPNIPQGSNPLQVNYQQPPAPVIEESRVAVKQLMRHAGEMLTSCDALRASRFRVGRTVMDSVLTSGGYVSDLVQGIILGPSAPRPSGQNPAIRDNSGEYTDVGYAVCWWVDELRLRATTVLEGIALSQMVNPQQDPGVYRELWAQIRALNISSAEAIASTYFYIGGLHKTCVVDQSPNSQRYCPGDRNTLKFDLSVLEGKANAVRNLMDTLRRYDNLKPGFPGGNSCVECTFAGYRYYAGEDRDQNFVPYPFFPPPQGANSSNSGPYIVYQSRQAITANGIRQNMDDGVTRYNGMAWQKAWDQYDLGYLNPAGPNSTPVNASAAPARQEGQFNLPLSNALTAPFVKSATTPPPANKADTPPVQNPNLNAQPVPFGDDDPSQPKIEK